jgi:hypothetical protein
MKDILQNSDTRISTLGGFLKSMITKITLRNALFYLFVTFFEVINQLWYARGDPVPINIDDF